MDVAGEPAADGDAGEGSGGGLWGVGFGVDGGFGGDEAGEVAEDAVDDAGADFDEEFLEHVGGFGFVLDEGVALAVGFEADGDAQGFDAGEVFDPEFGDDAEEDGAVDCSPALTVRLDRSVRSVQGRSLSLVSGAGHDGVVVSRLTPVAMLFVRCQDGLSHHPHEYASPADLAVALRVLTDFLQGLPNDLQD